MNVIKVCAFALSGFMSLSVDAGIIAYSSFEEPASGNLYVDTFDPLTDHALVNHVGQATVDFVGREELGFTSYYTNTRNDVGLSDGDNVGVASATNVVGAYSHGSQGFQLSDTDGKVTTTFTSVLLDGYENPQVFIDIFVADTGFETSDLLRVWATVDGGTEIDLINSRGLDINDLVDEGQWITLSASLFGYSYVSLAFELDSNSSAESVYFDNVVVSGDKKNVALPEPGALALLGLGLMGLVRITRRGN